MRCAKHDELRECKPRLSAVGGGGGGPGGAGPGETVELVTTLSAWVAG